MKILITGAGGFIGSHVARRLVKESYEVIGLDNGSSAIRKEIKGVRMFRGDVAVFEDVLKAGKNCKTVIHLAGLLGTNEIAEQGLINLANIVNINGTVNVLEFCRQTGARHIFATKPNPRSWMNPYTITKKASEDYCLMYSREYGVNTTALRLFYIYGEGQRQEPVNKYMPTFMKSALENRPIPIWNKGEQAIDCCYIGDVVEVFKRAVERPLEGFQIIDVGTGTPTTVIRIANKVINLTKSKSCLKFIGKRLGEPLRSTIVANTSACKKYFDFVPSTSLDEGLKKSLPWFKKKYRRK